MKLDTELIEELLNSSISSYKISLATGISRQMIGKLRNGQADFHKGSLENALSLYQFALEQKNEGNLMTKTDDALEEVTTKKALVNALKEKADEILLTGPLATEIYELKKAQLSDTERMGAELGSSGLLVILEYLINLLFEAGEKGEKTEKEIQRKIVQLYYIKRIDATSVLLRLKQLDY